MVKAGETLGEARFTVHAQSQSAQRTVSEGISIRPAAPLMRTVSFGVYDPEKPGDTPDKSSPELRSLYPELQNSEAAISLSAGLFVDALGLFMENYPYGCSEQLTSKAMIILALLSFSEKDSVKEKLKKDIQKTIAMLGSRINSDGSLGYWRRGDETGDPFVSVYAAHFMIDAGEKGIQAPRWMMDSIKENLKTRSKANEFELSGLFPQGYALYLRARTGEVVTAELDSMAARLDAVKSTAWHGSALSALVGSTYKLLRLDEKAKPYFEPTTSTDFSLLPFPLSNPALNAGLIGYLNVKHHGKSLTKDAVFSLLNRLDSNAPDSLSAAGLALGLVSSTASTDGVNDLSIKVGADTLPLTGEFIRKALIPLSAKTLAFAGPKDKPFFYTAVQSGFDKAPAQQGDRSHGVSIARDVVDANGASVPALKLGETYRVTLRVQVG